VEENIMAVWIVVSRMMGGSDAVRVFRSRVNATSFSQQHATDNTEVVEDGLFDGAVSVAYAAEAYDQVNDIHHFIGIYADYDQASYRAGKKGLVLTLQVLD
jgi:hypothetical protein